MGGAATGIFAVVALLGLTSRWDHRRRLRHSFISSYRIVARTPDSLRPWDRSDVFFRQQRWRGWNLRAPSLFIGGTVGGAVGYLDVAMFHHPADSVGAFALARMGAVFEGIIRAP